MWLMTLFDFLISNNGLAVDAGQKNNKVVLHQPLLVDFQWSLPGNGTHHHSAETAICLVCSLLW
jgi:hypothetical protein